MQSNTFKRVNRSSTACTLARRNPSLYAVAPSLETLCPSLETCSNFSLKSKFGMVNEMPPPPFFPRFLLGGPPHGISCIEDFLGALELFLFVGALDFEDFLFLLKSSSESESSSESSSSSSSSSESNLGLDLDLVLDLMDLDFDLDALLLETLPPRLFAPPRNETVTRLQKFRVN